MLLILMKLSFDPQTFFRFFFQDQDHGQDFTIKKSTPSKVIVYQDKF